MSLIEVRDLKKYYHLQAGGEENIVKALDGIDLVIEHGEFVAIVGPSGSGKSTLLQILGLLDQPTAGQYFFMGKDVTAFKDDQLTQVRSRSIGFIFQLFNLLPRTTVLDNAALPMIYRGGKVDYEKCKTILGRLGLGSHLLHTSAQLSGGQQQRVAIARSLVNEPAIIFADEPTGNLPQKQALEIIAELRFLNENGITVVIITHDESIANRTDRIIRIVDGKISSDVRSAQATCTRVLIGGEDAMQNLSRQRLWAETWKIAVNTLMRNKFRTFLTMLGIIIGVASVVSMLAIGEGAKSYMEESLRAMGSNMFHVETERPVSTNATKSKLRFSRLTVEDYEGLKDLQRRSRFITRISPVTQSRLIASNEGKILEVQVEGVSTDYEFMRANKPIAGRFFTERENQALERVCIIGYAVYQELFKKNENPIGSYIQLRDKRFRVIGLLPYKGANWSGDSDSIIIIPYLTAMKRLFGIKFFTLIFVQALDEVSIDRAMNEVSSTLRNLHRIPKDVSNDFRIKNYSEVRETIESATGTMANFIGIVALISLIVGGIGIMNIMLVSVVERTREIGIRKAIGARSRDILFQFLVESGLIGMLGGVCGIIVAFVLGKWMQGWMGWEVKFRLVFILMSFSFSVAVGVFFGLYPANKAAKLSPINALRYE